MSFENNHKERIHTYDFLLLLMLMFMLSFPLLQRSIEIPIKPIWISLKGYILFSQLSFSSWAPLRRFKWRHCHKVGKNEYSKCLFWESHKFYFFFLNVIFCFIPIVWMETRPQTDNLEQLNEGFIPRTQFNRTVSERGEERTFDRLKNIFLLESKNKVDFA